MLEQCEICPRRCRVNRERGERGFCRVGNRIIIAHFGPHFGEEPPISGKNGSGNVFFSSCNLRCLYCQNHQISHTLKGREIEAEELVRIFFEIEGLSCHNINLVSPTPYIPFLVKAIKLAKKEGLKIPFVYNTNAYENVEALRMLEGLIDIYLPDFKYFSPKVAKILSSAHDYRIHAERAILEMERQVGNLVMEDGIAKKGLLIRHLLLPNGLSGAKKIMEWIGNKLGKDTYISLMAQYCPLYRATEIPMLRRKITSDEYEEILSYLISNGFKNVFIQDLDSAGLYVPDFNADNPFLDRFNSILF